MLEVMDATGFGRDLAGLICQYAPVTRRNYFCVQCFKKVQPTEPFCQHCFSLILEKKKFVPEITSCFSEERCRDRAYNDWDRTCTKYCTQRKKRIVAFLTERANYIMLTASEMSSMKGELKRSYGFNFWPKMREAHVSCCSHCGTMMYGQNGYKEQCPHERKQVQIICTTFSEQRKIRSKYFKISIQENNI